MVGCVDAQKKELAEVAGMYVSINTNFILSILIPPYTHTHAHTLQSLKYVTKDSNGGRKITKEGQTALDQIAASVANADADE